MKHDKYSVILLQHNHKQNVNQRQYVSYKNDDELDLNSTELLQ